MLSANAVNVDLLSVKVFIIFQQPGPSGNKWEQFVEDNTCSQHNELDSDDNFEDGRYTTDASIFERQKKNRKR